MRKMQKYQNTVSLFLNIIFLFNLVNENLPSPFYETFDLRDMTRISLHRPRRTKTGLFRLPQVSTVRFGNYSLSYQTVVS